MNCDLIAGGYRWLEYASFGRALSRRRLEYLEDVTNARRVLILGDGDGRFTTDFLERNKTAAVDSIDLSAGMMRLAERRIRRRGCGGTRQVRLMVGDARTAELGGGYDLIVSHFFLDCFSNDDLESLMGRVSQAACPGVRWLISEFRVPGSGWRRVMGAALIGALYFGFRVLTGLQTDRLPDYAEALQRVGFRRVREKTGAGGLLVSELWRRG